jgi:hypothetical protein
MRSFRIVGVDGRFFFEDIPQLVYIINLLFISLIKKKNLSPLFIILCKKDN